MPYDEISSRPAFEENKEGKDYCRQMVFLTIRKLGPCNDREICKALGWEINRVTPRRGELVTEKKIIQESKRKDPNTNRTVSYWIERPNTKFVQQNLF